MAGLAGFGYLLRRVWRTRDAAVAIPILWVIAYIPTLLITEARFLRYTLPIIPVLAIAAAAALWAMMTTPSLRRSGQAITVGVLSVTAIWAFTFVSIYSGTHTRIAASEWIYDNVEPGSILTAESWDDALPLRIEGQTNSYRIQSLDIYGDLPPEEKVDQLYESVSMADYIVMSSDRLIYSVDNLPWRYAVQNEYYRRLLAGQLGFQLVYQAESRPELFGLRFDDSGADESFTVYDHPRVMIFKRVQELSRDEFRARLLWGVNQPWEPARYPSQQWLLLDEPVGERPSNGDIQWNDLAVDNAVIAIVLWLVVLELFGLAVLPWSAAIFSRTPDRGALAARLIGVLLTGWIVWIGASLRFWAASTVTVAAAIATLGLLNWGWYRWSQSTGRQLQLPTLRAYCAVFGFLLTVFLPFLLFRALYPDFWQTFLGGEKPFELAYLRAVAASPDMPPYDPWYSDGVINYYYYGWHLVSSVGRLPGVGVDHTFQLAIPTFAAFVAMLVASVGMLLAGARDRLASHRNGVVVAGFAVVAVLFAGNIDAARQIAEVRGRAPDLFDFWGSTRVIDFTINEFPYFSFIWADLHPHVMGLPVIALVLAILIAVSGSADEPSDSPPVSWAIIAIHGFVGAVALGSVFVINAWDLPLTIAVTVAAMIYAGLLRSRRQAVAYGLAGAVVVGSATSCSCLFMRTSTVSSRGLPGPRPVLPYASF